MLQGERPSTEVGAGDPDVTIHAVANVSALRSMKRFERR
jgi:hypothetical protein